MPYKDASKQREYQRVWCNKRNLAIKQEAVNILGGCCAHCGIDDIRVLQFDHKIPILRKWNEHQKSGPFISLQIVKGKLTADDVQVLCANCHAIKTIDDRINYFSRRTSSNG